MNFKVIHARERTSYETEYYLKDSDNNDWTFIVSKTRAGNIREFTMYPKHWKSLMKSTSLANLTRKSHLYELAMKAIEEWNMKKDLSPSTLNTFEDIIDEL
jgi:hypothetical protein